METTQKTTGCLVIFVRGYPKTVRIYAFPESYDKDMLASRYRNEYAHAPDAKTLQTFVLWVLSHAEIDGKRLGTQSAVNNALGLKLETVNEVFNTVLIHNAMHLEGKFSEPSIQKLMEDDDGR